MRTASSSRHTCIAPSEAVTVHQPSIRARKAAHDVVCDRRRSRDRRGGASQPIVRSLRTINDPENARTQERRDAVTEGSERGRGLGLFFTADYERFDKDTTRFETGFGRDTVGGTAGVDYILNRFVLLGLAVNYAHEFGNYVSGGGFDHDSYGVFVYTSLSPIPAAFVDLVAGYARKEYHFERRVLLDIAQEDPTFPIIHIEGTTRSGAEGDEVRFSAYGGYDFILRNITVGPRLGVNYRDATIDPYRESAAPALSSRTETKTSCR